MVDDDKPFPCSSPGCSMKFANEDHLSIHNKRHVSLTINPSGGCKTPTFIADETPTPTRFIRNCEEVGLFQDLVNPFDEQFRRASEVVQIPPSASVITDDVLHTPHVFPMESDTELLSSARAAPPKSSSVRRSYLMPTLSTSECLILPSPLLTPTPEITITEPENSAIKPTNNAQKKEKSRKLLAQPNSKIPLPQSSNGGVNIMPRPAGDPLQLLFRLPDGQLVQIPAMPVANEKDLSTMTVQTECDIQSKSKQALSETKEKLKQVLSKAKCVPNMGPNFCVTSSVPNESKPMMTESVGSGMNLIKLNSISRRRSFTSGSEPDQDEGEGEKRRKFLERNRAAAFRSRQKRKCWVSNLEAKTMSMNNANKLLQNEVSALRSEIAQLKLQLLAHKDCPVTLALLQASENNNDRKFSDPNHASLQCISPADTTRISPSRKIVILNTAQKVQTLSTNNGVPCLSSSVTASSNALSASTFPTDNANCVMKTSVIMSVKSSDRTQVL